MDGGMLVEAKTKLAERPIVWKEKYTKRTLFLKKQYHDVLGPGSYFRFEGHDTESDDDYFVVVGPAKVKSPKSEFFAGVRKLPADYAAGGLNFSSMKEAIDYANETWGVYVPKDLRYYDSNDLKGISQKIDKWKEENEENKTTDEDYLEEWFENLDEHGESTMSTTNDNSYFYVQSDAYPFFTKVAMPTWLRREVGFQWWDIDDILSGSSESFNAAAQSDGSLMAARDAAVEEKVKRQSQIGRMYGTEYAAPSNPDEAFYKVWLVYRGDRGTYIVSVGPYCGDYFEQAKDKFGVFTKKLNVATQEQIDAKVGELIREYAEKYNISLTNDDLNVNLEEKPFAGEITLGASGRAKLYGSPEWKRQILDRYGVQPGPGMTARLKERYREQLGEWKRRCDEAYAVSTENGEAFERAQPEPPSIALSKRMYGQQVPRSILRQNVSGGSKLDRIEQFGFDSIQEAVDHLNTTAMPGAPVGRLPHTTRESLAAARQSKAASDAAGGEQPAAKRRNPRIEKLLKDKPEKDMTEIAKPVTQPETKEKIDSPAAEPVQQDPEAMVGEFNPFDDDDFTFSSNLSRMIRMAEELDASGKYNEAEGIHKILRKHIPTAQ